MILDGIETIEFDRNKGKILGIKSAIIWGHKGNTASPLLYIRKPKSVSQEDFDELLGRMYIRIFEREVR